MTPADTAPKPTTPASASTAPVEPPSARQAEPPVTLARVLQLWWPLAASWMLMGLEMPMFTAVVARMADPEVHLAAYGSLVLPVSLMVEAPIIMLLAASTALAKDWRDYVKLRRFTLLSAGALTVVHAAIAFTPIFDVLAVQIIEIPAPVVEPARLGLRIMTPWTGAIALRRFQQGILVRFERSRAVGVGTGVRLIVNGAVLGIGYASGGLSGIAVGSLGLAAGVVAEDIFIGICVQPVLRERLKPTQASGEPLTRGAFLRFYVPLALTPALALAVQPVTAGAISRMPEAMTSLAAWPAVMGVVFVLRSVGFAYNEVVVALLGKPQGPPALKSFARLIAIGTTALLIAIAATPLAEIVFGEVLGLAPELVHVSRIALGCAGLMPAYTVVLHLFQGILVHTRRTRGVIEATSLYLVIVTGALVLGVQWQVIPGIYYGFLSLTTGALLQTAWMGWRSRAALRSLEA